MEYNFREIEKKWQEQWKESGIYHVSNSSDKPKYYVLDMFPYPSGSGLHVGHPLGYIASDIYARYKKLKGFNVLHPMGFDSFGLPAEQYALETGQHPAITTEKNIATFKNQLDKIGFCYDWGREIKTSDPEYYRWTQWIFLQLFKSWYNHKNEKAEPIETLIKIFEESGSAHCPMLNAYSFTAEEWKNFDEKNQQEILMNFRLAFSSYGEVNWCEALGTVLANDEVVNGLSERGGYPVEKKKMRQWYLRITDYADRLLKGLETVNFSDAMKEMQRNWIGRSEGAEMEFEVDGLGLKVSGSKKVESSKLKVKVYTTRPDTIFGVDFLVLAPEHELVNQITTEAQRTSIDEYLTYVKSRSDRERLAEVKQITGCFTGAYATNPFDRKQIPIWIAEYVLAGYGTGAIMAVPCGDQRDFDFAKHFNIPITNIIGNHFNGKEANPTKDAILENSGFLDGLLMKDAIEIAINKIEELGIGKRKVNYRMRDAGFSRQRYWGEPFPIIWSDGIAIPLEEKELPLELPFVEKYGPGKNGEGPLSNLTDWMNALVKVNLTPIPSPEERGEDKPSYITSDASTWKVLKPYARENRKEQTDAEKLLWTNLRNRNISNCKFRRQHAIGSFIVDFVCIEKKLVIEVDGDYHLDEEQKKYDQSRTDFLKESGFTEIRFSNEEIQKNISASLQKIREYLAEERSPLLGRGVRGEVKKGKRETSTMPGYAGSSWYFLRYMDSHNNETFADRKATDYWNQVDVYIGGTEHAVGHLLYSRLWTKVLYDLGLISFEEPFKKLVNQGMIQGSSRFVYRIELIGLSYTSNDPIFLSKTHYENLQTGQLSLVFALNYINRLIPNYCNIDNITEHSKIIVSPIHVDVNIVDGVELNTEAFKKSKPEYANAEFILEDGKYICGVETEKMSKSKYNTVNPNDLVDRYGADTFRMYEMFLGPVEQSKPWDTKGIEGVHRFLKKLWRLFYHEEKGKAWTEDKASDAELKTLHKTIKKIEEDTERFSFNTAVSAFMVCVNELTDLKCHKKEILEPLLVLLTPYAPHITEELYHLLRNKDSVLNASYPKLENKYLVESEKEYPVSINGKMRTTMTISLDATQEEVEKIVLNNDIVQKWIDGKTPKKIIFVKNKMVNVVV
jgi:leucyl-tRNA synthetase